MIIELLIVEEAENLFLKLTAGLPQNHCCQR